MRCLCFSTVARPFEKSLSRVIKAGRVVPDVYENFYIAG